MDQGVSEVLEGRAPWYAGVADCEAFANGLYEAHGECLELAVGSPPYEGRRTYGELNWDKRGEEWVAWMVGVVEAWLRPVKPGGAAAFVITGEQIDYEYSCAPELLAADLKRRGHHMRRKLIYYRQSVPGGSGKDFLRNDYEDVLFVQKSAGPLLFSDPTACGQPARWGLGGTMSYRLSNGKRVNEWGGTSEEAAGGQRQAKKRPSHNMLSKKESEQRRVEEKTTRERGGDMRTQVYKAPKISNPGNVVKEVYTAEEVACILAHYQVPGFTDVLHCNVGGNHMGHKRAHDNEAPFPLALAEFLVKTFSRPGNVVYDGFGGSGTTAHAAVKAGRRCLTVDARPSQLEIINGRCRAVQPDLFGATEPPASMARMDLGRPAGEEVGHGA